MKKSGFSSSLKSMNFLHSISRKPAADDAEEEEKSVVGYSGGMKSSTLRLISEEDIAKTEEANIVVPEMTQEEEILKLFHNYHFMEKYIIEDPSLMLVSSLNPANEADTIFYIQVYNQLKDKMVCSLKNKYENYFSKKNLSFFCKKGTIHDFCSNNIFIVRTDEFAVYALFAGHGPFGYYPSFFCQLKFSILIQKRRSELAKFDKIELTEVFKDIFKELNEELERKASNEEKRDMLLFSGTSITIVLQHFKMKQVWACNCGNAHAVIANKKGGKVCTEPLTEDHTPHNKTEKERIYLMGGEVRQFQKGDKERVCVRCRNYPGLMGTRSIGDLVASKIGVTHEPSIQAKEKNLKEQDVIVIGCEFFWENITPEEAGELVFLYGSKDVRDATKALFNNIKKKSPNGLIHDLAFIIIS